MSEGRYFEGIGRRKRAVARVRVLTAKGAAFAVNGEPAEKYFKNENLLSIIRRPLAEAKLSKVPAVNVKVQGGGPGGQAGAVAHGLARALIVYQPDLRPIFKKAKLLTRDPREKERRKFGLKKARKAPQWSKR